VPGAVQEGLGGQRVQDDDDDGRGVVAQRRAHGPGHVVVEAGRPPGDQRRRRGHEQELRQEDDRRRAGVAQERPARRQAHPHDGQQRDRHDAREQQLGGVARPPRDVLAEAPGGEAAQHADEGQVGPPTHPGPERPPEGADRRHGRHRHDGDDQAEGDDRAGVVGAPGGERLGGPAEAVEHRPAERERAQPGQLEQQPQLGGQAPPGGPVPLALPGVAGSLVVAARGAVLVDRGHGAGVGRDGPGHGLGSTR
jgi:hypothetical protein